MRKIILTALGGSLIAASMVQMAAAAERHHQGRKAARAPISQQFRNANNSLALPADTTPEFVIYNGGNAL